MRTITTWKTGQKFESEKDGHRIEIDGNGFSPKALLLSGLAACSGVDVVEILEKMRVPFASLVMEVGSDQTEEHPRVFKTIHITFKLKTEEQNREKVLKAIDLSLEKYCGVAAMLGKNSPIEYDLEIEADK